MKIQISSRISSPLFPAPSTHDLMLWHLLLGWLWPMWGFIRLFINWVCIHFEVGIPSLFTQGVLWSRDCFTWWAVCPTGPFRNVFKEGIRFSALFKTRRPGPLGKCPARQQFFAPASLPRASGNSITSRGPFQGLSQEVKKKKNPPSWTNRWVMDNNLSSEALNQFIAEAIKLLSQFRVQLTTGPWFERRLFPVFLWFILI